eukprot:640347-Amphidinium_carterae.1
MKVGLLRIHMSNQHVKRKEDMRSAALPFQVPVVEIADDKVKQLELNMHNDITQHSQQVIHASDAEHVN